VEDDDEAGGLVGGGRGGERRRREEEEKGVGLVSTRPPHYGRWTWTGTGGEKRKVKE